MTNKPALRSPSPQRLLARILDQPDLPAQVRSLPSAALGKLIDHVGLEDAGEIVALASTEQLSQVFDEDLWKNDRPGEDEHLDADRFLVWIEVLLEAGDSFAARRVTEMPEDLVTLALHRHVLVLTLDALSEEIEAAGEEAELLEKALSNCLYEELDEYQVISRGHDGWDTVLTLLLALDRDHHAFLSRVLDRLCHLSAEHIDGNGGLYDVLTSEEMLATDVAAEREDRRAAMGYVAPSAAASFLKLARHGEEETPAREHDPATRAYFRGLARAPSPAGVAASRAAPEGKRLPARGAPAGEAGLAELLRDAGVTAPAAEPRLLAAPAKGRPEPLLLRAMRALSSADPRRFNERTEELAYLTNVLVSGCSFRRRRLRPVEALHAVIATCSLGLELSMPLPRPRLRSAREAAALHLLRESTADGLFRIAWRRLHRLTRRAAALAKRRPELLAGALAGPDHEALEALLDECPSLAGTLAEGAPVEPALFLSTARELQRARRFVGQCGN